MDPHASIDTKYSLVFVDFHSNTSRTSMLNHWTEQQQQKRQENVLFSATHFLDGLKRQ